uniref:Uncharacterized protein n=1 Tax=Arundo donax TaxID=35708 RepID=A0A0A8YY21_ARUDO
MKIMFQIVVLIQLITNSLPHVFQQTFSLSDSRVLTMALL